MAGTGASAVMPAIAVRRTASFGRLWAGIQYAAAIAVLAVDALEYWIPAFAGMTAEIVGISVA
jgi:hypothetical protein